MRWLKRIFGKRPQVEADLEVCDLWLEAGPFPFPWFCQQPREVQEALADLGIVNDRAKALAVAKAIHNPALFEAEHFGTEEEQDSVRLETAAHAALMRFMGTPSAAPKSRPVDLKRNPPQTMAGQLEANRRESEEREAIRAAHLRPSLHRTRRPPEEVT